MYDIERRRKFGTVGYLKELLNDIPDETLVSVGGDSQAWFHVKKDNSLVCLDNEDLEECYEATDLDWDKAIDYLNTLLDMYASLGPDGVFGYVLILGPLKRRYENGERTAKLYNEIMECE